MYLFNSINCMYVYIVFMYLFDSINCIFVYIVFMYLFNSMYVLWTDRQKLKKIAREVKHLLK